MSLKGTITFLKSFATDKDVASITPSSQYCVRKLCSLIDFDETKTIVEYGGGTGVFTKYLLGRMRDDAQLYVFETNDNFYKKLSSINDPRLTVFHKSVEEMMDLLPNDTVGNVDHIISGIPFSFFNWDLKISILDKTISTLKHDGSFLAYQTTGHLKKPLMTVFQNYDTTFCWKNIPPYFIYEAVKKAG
ncbi:MAG: hypothetical protein FH748_05260 [Balneolaceae bacterium]|nr:hypothetical protein [Balneolaceae bacterium]